MFLTFGQIVRGLATRKFLSNYVLMSHRLIFGFNGIGAVFNFFFSFRVGDLLRLFLLSKSKLGTRISFYFIVVERVSDLLIANLVFFTLGLIYPNLAFSNINFFGLMVGILGFFILLYGKSIFPSKKTTCQTFNLFRSLDLVFGKREIVQFFTSLVWSWVLTTCAFLILSRDSLSLLQDWVSVNSSFNDPNTFIFETNRVLLVTLLIPLALAFIYSYSLPSPKKLARISMNSFIHKDSKVEQISAFNSSYAGSGANLFQADVRNIVLDTSEKYLVRVESRRDSGLDPAKFMRSASKAYRFPDVLFVKEFTRARCTILELISDSDSNDPSKNSFELMIESNQEMQLSIIASLVEHIKGFHADSDTVLPSASNQSSKKSLLLELEKRIERSSAFAFLGLNLFRKEERRLYLEVNEIRLQLLSGLKELKERIEIGGSHGDASMSNFLFQYRRGSIEIRSIDPNPRFNIGNLEYDLAKVMQSTHALYEFLLTDFNSFPGDIPTFQAARSKLGWSKAFDESVGGLAAGCEIDKELLQFFFVLHLFRIIPYKVNGNSVEFKRYLNLLWWNSLDADF